MTGNTVNNVKVTSGTPCSKATSVIIETIHSEVMCLACPLSVFTPFGLDRAMI